MLHSIFVFILTLAVGTFQCLAQTCTVKGHVADLHSGERLVGAAVRNATNLQNGTIANENGEFSLIAAIGDTLLVTYMGYEDEKIFIAALISCEAAVRLNLIMKKIEAVEIKAERIIAEEFTIRKLKKLDIYTNPSAKADPILTVNAMPSATTTDESANISLRGGSPAETGIFFNGVPINDAVRYSQMNGIGTFSIFNTALINTVQVYPGNPPLEYGNSTSGLIALQTDENIPDRSVSTLSLTMASVGFYHSRKLGERSSLTCFSNHQPSALIRKINARSMENLKGFSSTDVGMHYYKKLKGNAIIKIFNYSLYESYKFHYTEPTFDGIFHQRKARNFTVANFRKRIGNTELSFNQGASFSNAVYTYSTTDIDLSLYDLFSSFNIHHTGVANEWKTGISYDHKASHFEGTFPVFDFATAQHHPVAQASSRNHVSNPEWYGYYKHYLGTRWIAGGGIRKNIAIEKLKDYFSIQGNLHYAPTEAFTVNLSAGRYHKYQLPQGESTSPFLIRSNQYSADISYSNPTTETSLSAYYKEGLMGERETQVKGLELFVRRRVTRNLRFQVSLTSLDAMMYNDSTKKPSPYNIHYFVRGNIEYKILGTWTITTVFLFRQGSYHYPVTSAAYNAPLQAYEPTYAVTPDRLPAYNTIDMNISRIFMLTPKTTAIAFISAGNITNQKNVRTYTYDFDYSTRQENLFSQRTFYCGLIINF